MPLALDWHWHAWIARPVFAMERSSVIFIHGASSAGKSTLARAVQAAIDQPFWHVSIDHLRDAGVLPSSRFKSGDFDWKAARPAFFDGFHLSLAAYLQAGNNLILEHILDTPGWREQLADLFKPYDVFFVGLHADLDELNKREVERGDRPIGSAAHDFHTVHRGLSYDLELSSRAPLNKNVQCLITAWKAQRGQSAFFTPC